jgi:hypothetical protein
VLDGSEPVRDHRERIREGDKINSSLALCGSPDGGITLNSLDIFPAVCLDALLGN